MEAVTAKERSRHKDAGNNGPNERWPIGPRLPHFPISDRDRSLAVTALSLAVATVAAGLTKISFTNGASYAGGPIDKMTSSKAFSLPW